MDYGIANPNVDYSGGLFGDTGEVPVQDVVYAGNGTTYDPAYDSLPVRYETSSSGNPFLDSLNQLGQTLTGALGAVTNQGSNLASNLSGIRGLFGTNGNTNQTPSNSGGSNVTTYLLIGAVIFGAIYLLKK